MVVGREEVPERRREDEGKVNLSFFAMRGVSPDPSLLFQFFPRLFFQLCQLSNAPVSFTAASLLHEGMQTDHEELPLTSPCMWWSVPHIAMCVSVDPPIRLGQIERLLVALPVQEMSSKPDAVRCRPATRKVPRPQISRWGED